MKSSNFFEWAAGIAIIVLGTLASLLIILALISMFCGDKPETAKSSCAGTVKGFYFEDNQIRIVTENGVFIYDDEGHLLKEEKK